MLFQELGKLKQQWIMTSIILMAIGIVMIICPTMYTDMLVAVLGYSMLIISTVMILDFISSKNALVHYVSLAAALVIGIFGLAVLIFNNSVVTVLGTIFGIFLILDGLYGLFNAWLFARRSQRKGWEILMGLSGLTVLFGLFIWAHPWWHSPHSLLQVIGFMLLFSSIVGIVKFIMIWPIKDV